MLAATPAPETAKPAVSPSVKALMPSISITGAPRYPVAVLPSILTGWVIVGSGTSTGSIVAGPVISPKVISSVSGFSLARRIASRSVHSMEEFTQPSGWAKSASVSTSKFCAEAKAGTSSKPKMATASVVTCLKRIGHLNRTPNMRPGPKNRLSCGRRCRSSHVS